jgi:hypothetical protein
MFTPWPARVTRVPDEDWVHTPVEELARKYDTVEVVHRAAMEHVFRGRQSFQAIWTYISASRLQ